MVYLTKRRFRICKEDFFPFIYYTMFYTSLFITDMGFEQRYTTVTAAILKGIVLICLTIHTVLRKWRKSELYRMAIALGIGLILLLYSGDFVWLIILLMGFTLSEVNEDKLLKISIKCIVFWGLTTIFLNRLRVLPDLISYRTDFSDYARHSFGFAHSNILPLCIFYLLAYYVSLNHEKERRVPVLLLTAVSIGVYGFCNSRNALIGVILLAGASCYLGRIKKGGFVSKVTAFAAKWSVLLFSVISILPAYLRLRHYMMNLWYAYDKIFTNRTQLGAAAINAYGISFINPMNAYDYFSKIVVIDGFQKKGIILDNGYMYMLIRYGIAALLILIFINISIVVVRKDDIVFCAVLLIIACVNMTDNDFLSYGFLPYMLMGIRNLLNQKARPDCRKSIILLDNTV